MNESLSAYLIQLPYMIYLLDKSIISNTTF